jgi:peptidoglycan/xylan/chitin deacetylase (PgdA/CDA1 family)
MPQSRKLVIILSFILACTIAVFAATLLLTRRGSPTLTPHAQQPKPTLQQPARPTAVPPPVTSSPEGPSIAPTPTAPDYSPHPRFDAKAAANAAKDSDGEITGAAVPNDAVALTFDAGASGEPTSAILDALAAAGLRVTFFLTGKWCEENPDLAKRITADGHEIGNHTYSHPDLRKLTNDEITDQLRQTNKQIILATGYSCKGLFRPPYGDFDKRVAAVVDAEGYGVIRWSLDSWDAWKEGITKDEIEARVLEKIKPGSIVLMHCGSRPTADALPDMISKIEAEGLRIVTVSALIAGNSQQPKRAQDDATGRDAHL